MLNLLFISDSPKAEYIKSVLQPVLKVIIDVVTDFDHGLKDVFEKRPTTVCIQDHISGVTGESVARHIQMLLGNSAPTFILLHTGSGKARAITGLYEHLIDLSQPNDALAEDIKSTLKSLLGDQWEKIYIPPRLTPASIMSSVAVPEESREVADKLVDDFLSDLETTGFSVIDDQPLVMAAPETVTGKSAVTAPIVVPQQSEISSGTIEFDRAQSISDDLAEMLLAEAHKSIRNDEPVEAPYNINDRSEVVFNLTPKQVPSAVKSRSLIQPVAPELPTVVGPLINTMDSRPVTNDVSSAEAFPVQNQTIKDASQTALSQNTVKSNMPVVSQAAEFKIRQNTSVDEEHIPEDLLLAFEENYRSESRFLRRSVIVVFVFVVCAVGIWFLVTYQPHVLSALRLKVLSFAGKKQVPLAVSPVAPVPKPEITPAPKSVGISTVPAFISKEVHDRSYAAENPGWERYVGKNVEYRIFSVAGSIQAVQVLAVKNTHVPESLLKSVLKEIAGSSKYTVLSQKTKEGLRVEAGKVDTKGDVIVYRKKGAVKAFVVSIN